MAGLNESRFTIFSNEEQPLTDNTTELSVTLDFLKETEVRFSNRDSRLDDKAIKLAYDKRRIRPVVSNDNLNKAMKVVPPARGTNRTYDGRNPVWAIEPLRATNQNEWQQIFMLYETLVDIGVPLHPLMQNKFFRRVYYAKLMDGQIHHLFKKTVYTFSPAAAKIVKRNLRQVGEGLYEWLVEDRSSTVNRKKKISLVVALKQIEGLYDFNLAQQKSRQVVVQGHGNVFIEKYNNMPMQMKVATNVLGGAVVSGLLGTASSQVPWVYTGALIAGAVYLANNYMNIKAEGMVYKILMRKIGMLKEYILSSYKSVRDNIAEALTAITGSDSDTTRCLIDCVAIALTGYALWKILYNSPEGQEQIKILIPSEARSTVEGHTGGFGPILTTFLVSMCVLPPSAVAMLRSYRSVSQIYGDIIGPQGISTFLKIGVNFVCELMGTEKLFDIIDQFQAITDIIEEMNSVITDENLVSKQSKDKNFYAYVFDLQRRTWQMSSLLMRTRDIPFNMNNSFKECKRKIDDIVDITRTSNITFTKRDPLTVLYFPGPPGQGKSTLCDGVAQAVYQLVERKKMNVAETWRKNFASEYDDGYKGQWHVDIPELFSSKMPTTNEPQANMFKLWCDAAAYPMNMSKATEKGTVYFNSKFLTMSSNDSKFENIGIKQPGSIYRRINFPMSVTRANSIDVDEAPTVEDLDAAWVLSITKHAKQHRNMYTGVSKFLGDDWNKTWTVSEFILIVYEHHMYYQSALSVGDLFGEIDWVKELSVKRRENVELDDFVSEDEEEPLLVTRKIADLSPMIKRRGNPQAHGLWSSVKSIFISDVKTRLLKWFGNDEMVVVVPAVTISDSVIRAGSASKHAGLFLVKGYETKLLHFEDTLKLDDKFDMDNWQTEHKYQLRIKPLVERVSEWQVRNWDLKFNCHSLLSELMKQDHEDFVIPIWKDTAFSTAEMGDSREEIVNGFRYFDPFKGAIMTGKELRAIYPLLDVSTEFEKKLGTWIPTADQTYLTTPLGGKWASVASSPLEYYSPEHVFTEGNLRRCLYERGVIVDKYVDLDSLELWRKAKPKHRHEIVIGGDVWLVDFARYDQGIVSKYTDYVKDFLTRNTPNSVKDYVDIRGKQVFLDITVLLAGAFVLQSYLVPIVTKCVSFMWTWMFPMESEEKTYGHSVQKTVQFKPKTDRVVVKGHTSGDVSIIANVASNTVNAEVIYANGTIECKMFFINQKNAYIVQHAIMRPGEIRGIRVKADGATGITTSFKDIKVIGVEGSELKQLVFSSSQGSFKDLRKKYMTKNELRQEFDTGFIIRKNFTSSNKKAINVTQNLISRLHKGSDVDFSLSYLDIDGTSKTYKLREKYTAFNSVLGPGDCVTPLLVEVNGNLKILGHYFGQVEGVSYFAPTFQERIQLEDNYQIPPVRDQDITVKANAKLIEGLTCLGKLPVSYRGPIKNGILDGPILKTELGTEGMFDVNKFRATLSGPVVDYAFKFGNGQIEKPLPSLLVNLKKKYPLMYYQGFAEIPKRKMKFLSVDEAIFSNEFGIKSLDQTTSTGPYLSLGLGEHLGLPKSAKRIDYFDHQTNWVLPAFREHLEQIRTDHEDGNQHIPLVGLTPKVEMRPEGKRMIINGRTYTVPRLFGNGDLSILIEHKRVFGMLFEHMKNYYQITGDMVGINPFGFGWKGLYDELRKFPNVFTTDISGCDVCHTAEEVDEFFEFCNEYFFHFKKDTKNYRRLKCACESVLSVWYMWEDVLYISAGKNPSGCLMTCIINAFMIYTRFQRAFYGLQYKHLKETEVSGKKMELERFSTHVCCKLFGDDSVVTVSDQVKGWYNRVSIINWLQETYGMKVTDAKKSQYPTKFDNWDEIDFLQRRFICDRGGSLVKAPLAKESLYKCLYYIDKKPGNGTSQEWIDYYDQVLQGCMHELAMHEKDVYDEFVASIRPRFQLMGGNWNYPSYEEIYQDYYDKYYLS